jgi:hypothetical protein
MMAVCHRIRKSFSSVKKKKKLFSPFPPPANRGNKICLFKKILTTEYFVEINLKKKKSIPVD